MRIPPVKNRLLEVVYFCVIMFVCARAWAEPCHVLVFDFAERGPGRDHAWVGPALADAVASAIDADAQCRAVPHLAVRRYTQNGDPPFERKWELLDAMKASAFVEGSYSFKGNAMSFQGTVVRASDSDIQDISFTLNSFTFDAAQKRLMDVLVKILKIKLNSGASVLGTNSAKAHETYWKAESALARGEEKRADALAEEALGADPAMAAACALRGRIALEAGDYGKAADRLEKCLASNKKYPETLYYLGQVYAGQKKLAAAREHLREAAEAQPANPLFQWKLGEFYRKSSVLDKALDALQKAVSLDAALAPAWYEIALIHAHAKNRDKALDNLQKAVRQGGAPIADRARTAPEFEWLRRDTRFFDILRSAPR